MRNKAITVLVLFTICLFGIHACGRKEQSDEAKISVQANDESFKIGVIYCGDYKEMYSFSYSHEQGIQDMQKALHLTDAQVIRENQVIPGDKEQLEKALKHCIRNQCKVIYGISMVYADEMERYAKKYPNIVFSCMNGMKNNGKNLNSYYGKIYEARYLTGLAAGDKTMSNHIGFVAPQGKDNSEVTSEVNAFARGVKKENPAAKVYVYVTGKWSDKKKEHQAVKCLRDIKCDVITTHTDTSEVIRYANQYKIANCGYHCDVTPLAKETHLFAAMWNWSIYYTQTTKAIQSKSWACKNYEGSLIDGLVGISPITDNCPDGTEAIVNSEKDKMIRGKLNVFSKAEQNQILTGTMNEYEDNVVRLLFD